MLNGMLAPATDPRVLVVDDEPLIRELLCSFLEQHGYACRPCASAEDATQRLEHERFDLIISDYRMPGQTGLDLLRAARRLQPEASFLMATATQEADVAVQAMRDGAMDYLFKPLQLRQVLAAVERALERRRDLAEAELARQELERLLSERTRQLGGVMRQLQSASAEVLEALGMALDLRAREVAGHSLRVSRYAVELASHLGYEPEGLSRLAQAAWVHDIGKLGIPDAILNKPEPLTAAETAIMRGHVQIGLTLVHKVPSLVGAADLVAAHHERYDGGGYPAGLAGEEIPRDARIFAVADALDAITSDRPYRSARGWREAASEIAAQANRQFDPVVVNAFLSIPLERWQRLQQEASLTQAAGAAQ